MIVVIETVLAIITDIDVRPSVVIVIPDGHAEAPTLIGYARLLRNVCERAVMIIVEQGSARRPRLACEPVIAGTVDKVNIQPAIVVIVQQGDSGTVFLDDELLLKRPHGVVPSGESSFLGDVVKDNRPAVHETTGGDWPLLGIKHGSSRGSGGHDTLRTGCGLRGASTRRNCMGGKKHGPRSWKSQEQECKGEVKRPVYCCFGQQDNCS